MEYFIFQFFSIWFVLILIILFDINHLLAHSHVTNNNNILKVIEDFYLTH